MRWILLLVLVVGCVGEPVDPGAPDAGSDVEPEAPDANTLTFPEPGDYVVEWSREGGAGTIPATVYNRVTVVDGRMVYWWYESCFACGVYDSIGHDSDCLLGSGIPQGDAQATEPYTLCPDGDGGAFGQVVAPDYPGPAGDAVWHVELKPI